MWIVNIALKRPYTFVVLALLILVISPIVILRTPVDIFPNINIPVVSVLWNYGGMNAEEMEERITSVYERVLTTVVNDIDHIESQSLNGIAVVKVFFHPNAKLETAFGQVNLSYSTSAPVGTMDADLLVSLAPGHRPTDDYMRELRERLPREFPGVSFYFLPADIISQILNFGLPAPLDIQIAGLNLEANHAFATDLLRQLKLVPGAVDLRIQQLFDQPNLHIYVDRTKTAESGFTQLDVASSMLVSLSGSFQTAPTFGWIRGAA